MIGKIRSTLARHAVNYRGWRTERKIIVIESDDWGSTCMPSAAAFQKLVRKGIRVDRCPYTSYDALASEQDLEDLFSVLAGFRGRNNTSPVFTANAVMMNPDFEKIRSAGFTDYYGEPFTETLKRYPKHSGSFALWEKGIREGLFYPQFHGREHLNVKGWMKSLEKRDSIYRAIFDEEMYWPGSAEEEKGGVSLRAAFDADDLNELDLHRDILRDGLKQFQKMFGTTSESFIAPNFVYHSDLDKTLLENGVRFIQGMKYQKLPLAGDAERKMIRRIHGHKNGLGQMNLVRNCVFEPSQYPESFDSVGHCLKGIKNAFLWKKPAIITAHRLNFIGYIDPQNRERNLALLRSLLKNIVKLWPDAEFLTSPELGKLMLSEGKPH